MSKLYARLLRWFHCLTHLHQPATLWVDGITVVIACDCGKLFYHNCAEIKALPAGWWVKLREEIERNG